MKLVLQLYCIIVDSIDDPSPIIIGFSPPALVKRALVDSEHAQTMATCVYVHFFPTEGKRALLLHIIYKSIKKKLNN